MLCLQSMKHLSVTALIFAFIICPPLQAAGQSNDVFLPIAKYMALGDAESLSAWFAPSLEIIMPNSMPSECSKSQATQIMKAFFKTYRPEDVTIDHYVSNGNLKYALAKMKTSEEAFIVTIFVSLNSRRGYQIQQLKIERGRMPIS